MSKLILADQGAASWDDRMFVVKVIVMVNFHHEHSIVPTSCPWVSEDGLSPIMGVYFI